MLVKARAVTFVDGRLLLASERRRGRTHLSLPGGRVRDRESATDALVREVAEETGVTVTVGRLVYVAEVAGGYRVHDLNLIFEAHATGPLPGRLELLDLDRTPWPDVMPPLVDRIARDVAAGWPPPTRWLGNLRGAARSG